MKTKKGETALSLSTVQAHGPSEPLPATPVRDAPVPEVPDDEAASLGKVRELLFGDQARETDKRFRELEKHYSDEIRRIDRDVSERMENLGRDLYMKLVRLEGRIALVESALQKHVEKSAEQMGTLRDELAERIVDGSHTLNRRITESHEKAIAHAEKATGALEEAKVGRETLAELLSEMASRVSG